MESTQGILLRFSNIQRARCILYSPNEDTFKLTGFDNAIVQDEVYSLVAASSGDIEAIYTGSFER